MSQQAITAASPTAPADGQPTFAVPVPAPLKWTFRLLERAAPRLGALLAERLWLTLPPRRRRDAHPFDTGEPADVRVDGRRVWARSWGEGPAVYLVHGWGGHSGQLAEFVAPIVASGHRVVAFDALSHGGSDPGALGRRRTTLPEMVTALRAVVEEVGPARAVIAHSLGCMATATAVREGLRVGRLAFVAPMGAPGPYMVAFGRALGFGARIEAGFFRRLHRRAGRPMSYYDIDAVPGTVDVPPLLLVHDRGDKETMWGDSARVEAAWPGSRLLPTEGLGHRRILRDPAVVASVASFVVGGTDA